MSKSVMLLSTNTALASGRRGAPFGVDSFANASDTNCAIPVTEQIAFTELGMRINGGNSGTATLVFRDTGADGSQTDSQAGTGVIQCTQTDTLTNGDTFGFGYTDTGTDSNFPWIKQELEPADTSYSLNYHGCANYSGTGLTQNGVTRYQHMTGAIFNAALSSTEGPAQWLNRAYTSIEAAWIFITANARTTDITFDLRVNGASPAGGLALTVVGGAGTTGLVAFTGNPITLADGDLWNLRMQFGASADALTISYIVCLCKSTSGKFDMFGYSGSARAASATEHFAPPGGRGTNLFSAPYSLADAAVPISFPCVASNPRFRANANTYTGSPVFNAYNGVSAFSTTNISGTGFQEDASSTSTLAGGEEIALGWDEGTTGSMTVGCYGLTFSPVAGGTFLNPFSGRGGAAAQPLRMT